MNDKETFIFNNLNNKSNAIFGFLVIQSLLLADKLSHTEFKEKLTEWVFLKHYIVLAHGLITIIAIILLIVVQRKMNEQLGDIKKEIFANQTAIVKIILIMVFSFIPIYVLLYI